MGNIHLLPTNIISKIAAGEVIERPASVIKELVENSLDSGATNIKIITKKGGKTLIKVIDNGSGMTKDDLVMCATRHATSKIYDEKDLYRIISFGFRGEALFSMAAVGNLTISSKTSQDEIGWEAKFDHLGKCSKLSQKSMETGTIVSLSSLFSELPVRLKLLKSDEVEDNYNLKTLYRFILSNPNVKFEFQSGRGNIIFPPGELIDRITMVFGKDVSENMFSVNYSSQHMNWLKVVGYVTKPTYTRKTKDFQYIFVNGRYVKSKYITDLVYNGYNMFGKLFLDRHPAFVLNIIIPPELIDVNVHPAKLEIKFVKDVSYDISNAIYNVIKSMDNILIADTSHGSNMRTNIYTEHGKQTTLTMQNIKTSAGTTKQNYEIKLLESSDGWNKLLPINVYGIANRTYIVGEDKLGMILIDQHASEERVNFEKLMKQFKKQNIQKQNLLVPITIITSPQEYEIIEANIRKYNDAGFTIEPYGQNTFILRSVPTLLSNASSDELSTLILDMAHKINLPYEKFYHYIATKACRMSIKGGDLISNEYAYNLIKELDKCDNPYMCPHGRPTIIRFTWSDLEKKFKRKG